MPLFPPPGVIRGDVIVAADGTLQAWSFDPLMSYQTGQTIGTGVVTLTRIAIPRTTLVSTITIVVTGAGSAAGTAANCFVGLYDVTGATLLGVSATQAANWSTAGVKAIPLVTPVTVSGGPGAAVLGAMLIGTQYTTTSCTFAGSSASATITSNAGFGFRCGIGPSAQTSLPASVTPVPQVRAYFMGLS